MFSKHLGPFVFLSNLKQFNFILKLFKVKLFFLFEFFYFLFHGIYYNSGFVHCVCFNRVNFLLCVIVDRMINYFLHFHMMFFFLYFLHFHTMFFFLYFIHFVAFHELFITFSALFIHFFKITTFFFVRIHVRLLLRLVTVT